MPAFGLDGENLDRQRDAMAEIGLAIGRDSGDYRPLGIDVNMLGSKVKSFCRVNGHRDSLSNRSSGGQ